MKLKDCITADLYRYCKDTSLKSFLKTYINSEGFKFTVWLRLCYFGRKKKITRYTIFPFCRIIYKYYKYKYGYDIPYACEIGKGLLIFHIGGIVFSAARCGVNLTLSQNTTVGMKIKSGNKEFPTIGNNVYIAPGAAIIGGINVGDNVAVGTNCVLTKSVPDNAVVVGVPGKAISYNGAKEYIINPVGEDGNG